MLAFIVVVFTSVAMVTCDIGTNMDQSNGNWAYEWYMGESFEMTCNTSLLNVKATEWIVWETPKHGVINSTVDNDYFKVEHKDSVTHFVLLIKKVEPMFSGVYTCHVFNRSMVNRGKATFGLNVHGEKLRDTGDQYSYNIKVAFIATAVFLVPALTICVVFHCRYTSEEDKMRRKQKKEGVKNYAYSMDEGVSDRDLPNTKNSNAGSDTRL